MQRFRVFPKGNPVQFAEGVLFSEGSVALESFQGQETKLMTLRYLQQFLNRNRNLVIVWIDTPEGKVSTFYERGFSNAIQDNFENCPFASLGGLDKRNDPTFPSWADDEEQYYAGYTDAAQQLYGSDWRTCEFSWKPVLNLP